MTNWPSNWPFWSSNVKKSISVFNEMFQNDCDLIYTQKRFEHHQIRSLKNRKWSPHVVLKIQSKHLCWSGIAETSPWNADTWPQRIDGFGLVQLAQATSRKQFSCILQRKCIPPGKYMAQLPCIGLSWRLTNRHRTWEWRRAIYSQHSVFLWQGGLATAAQDSSSWTMDPRQRKTRHFRTASLQENGQEAFTHLFLKMKSNFILEVSHISKKKRKKKLPSNALYKLCIIMTIVVIDSTLYDNMSSLLEPHLEVLCQEIMDIKERS